MISQLTINDIFKIRTSKVFNTFKSSYKQFAEQLQKLEILSKRISKDELQSLKSKIRTRFMQKYFKEMSKFENKKEKWNLSEMIFFQ